MERCDRRGKGERKGEVEGMVEEGIDGGEAGWGRGCASIGKDVPSLTLLAGTMGARGCRISTNPPSR